MVLWEILVFYYLSLSASEIWPDKRGVLSHISELSVSEIWPDKRDGLSWVGQGWRVCSKYFNDESVHLRSDPIRGGIQDESVHLRSDMGMALQ